MHIIHDKVKPLARFILDQAKRGRTIAYPQIYGFFDDGTPSASVWETFEAACRALAAPADAIYGALMALKEGGIPKDGFYDIFKNIRHTEYVRLAGGIRAELGQLTTPQKRAMADFERARVYQHAPNVVPPV